MCKSTHGKQFHHELELLYNADIGKLIAYIRTDAYVGRVANSDGDYAAHVLLKSSAYSLEFVETALFALLEHDSKSCSMRDRQGRLPLHLVLHSPLTANEELILTMLGIPRDTK